MLSYLQYSSGANDFSTVINLKIINLPFLFYRIYQCCRYAVSTTTKAIIYYIKETYFTHECFTCFSGVLTYLTNYYTFTRKSVLVRYRYGSRYMLVLVGTCWYSFVLDTGWYRLLHAGTCWYKLLQVGSCLYRLVHVGTVWYSLD